MKKILIVLSTVATGVTTGLNLKKIVDEYEIPLLTITVDQKLYLKNMKVHLKNSLKRGDSNEILHLASWADGYIQEFNATKAHYNIADDQTVDTKSIEKFFNETKKYLAKNENTQLTLTLENLFKHAEDVQNSINEAVSEFTVNEKYRTSHTLKLLINQYDRIFRDFTKLNSIPEIIEGKISLEQKKLFEKIKHMIGEEIATETFNYISLFLMEIEHELEKIKVSLKEKKLTIKTTELVNELHKKFKTIKSEMEVLVIEGFQEAFSVKVNEINLLITQLKATFVKDSKEILSLWEQLFATKGLSLLSHIKNIETEGEFEKIEELLKSFKKEKNQFLSFKNEVTDLNLDFKPAMESFNNIKRLFYEVKYIGINKAVSHGSYSQWWSSELAWKAWVTNSGFAGLSIPMWATGLEAAWRGTARLKAKLVARQIVNNFTIGTAIEMEAVAEVAKESGKMAAKTTARTVFAGVWVGLAIGVGLFALPSYFLNTIKTNGAGLTYQYTAGGHITGYLAPSIQIGQTAKPQETKNLDVFEIFKD